MTITSQQVKRDIERALRTYRLKAKVTIKRPGGEYFIQVLRLDIKGIALNKQFIDTDIRFAFTVAMGILAFEIRPIQIFVIWPVNDQKEIKPYSP